MTPIPPTNPTPIAALREAIAHHDPVSPIGCAARAIVNAIELELDYDLWDDAADLATALPIIDPSLQPALTAFIRAYEEWMQEASHAA